MATKTSKDVVLVNCQDVPETICVETRFITHAASKQKKYDNLYYITSNGSFEMITSADQLIPAKIMKPVSNPTSVRGATAQQRQVPQQTEPPCSMLPKSTLISNVNNNINLAPLQSLNSTSVLHSNNTSLLQPVNLNTSDLPTTTLGNRNCLSMPNATNSYSDNVHLHDASAFNTKSIAVQCEIDEIIDLDDGWPEIIEDPLECNTNLETENGLLTYIEENSTQHRNCKECLICGELCKSNKYFYGHMVLHRGPKVLCYKCGQYLDHDNLLLKHKCSKARKLQKAFLQCPDHKCSIKAISPQELFDHINEHVNNRMYKCSSCHKSFCTGQEFLRHLLVRAKCYTGAKRKRLRVYGLESQRDRLCRVRVFTLHTFKKRTTLVKTFLSKRVAKLGFCRICLKHFANKSIYNRHRVVCTAKFRKRLMRKKLK